MRSSYFLARMGTPLGEVPQRQNHIPQLDEHPSVLFEPLAVVHLNFRNLPDRIPQVFVKDVQPRHVTVHAIEAGRQLFVYPIDAYRQLLVHMIDAGRQLLVDAINAGRQLLVHMIDAGRHPRLSAIQACTKVVHMASGTRRCETHAAGIRRAIPGPTSPRDAPSAALPSSTR
jgi:hypothetical protein